MNKTIITILILIVALSCKTEESVKVTPTFKHVVAHNNLLNYTVTPKNKFDKSGLMFSDQGAWFAYAFSETKNKAGFSGPFLMTQQNGVWSSEKLAALVIKNQQWVNRTTVSYNSHLKQVYISKNLQLVQKLVFRSGHTAIIQSEIKNISDETQIVEYQWENTPVLADGLSLSSEGKEIKITSEKTNAIGYLQFPVEIAYCKNNAYQTKQSEVNLKPNETKTVTVSQTFIFPEYSWEEERKNSKSTNFDKLLNKRKQEKETQLKALINNRKPQFKDSIYAQVLAKAQLTLQNNWRIPAGEIKHEGLFPSYHYVWFNGFWSWDSWKHSAGLAYYNIELAKKQIKLMFEFQNEDGFVADCVYRDTTIEAHNYRDTKPPLSAWSVVKVFEKSKDTAFVQYMYPKLKKYHSWWYAKRDHDRDELCEYGSTDGSLVAAKWESGMDNAIRFDNSKILKNSEDAYSLNQESVDLNAYLFAEKHYLKTLARILNKKEEAQIYHREASELKNKIQEQFYDANDGWFYDTNLEGNQFIKGEGSEGWTALWANAATKEQADKVKERMMNPDKFYTKVPFQTMSADHEKFDPLKGYWRGPNWLDQAYFGVKALRNYGYNSEADKATIQILKGAEGILQKGPAIRENYHPLTGEGLHAHNFSWSAAHIIMLLQKD
ncbi:trehalase [Tenacibaculum holothuriorum]|uniref:Trehalase n=1 Tax=Tenacibaculum holothuriorum TaxID=1635173 RepID=A0A1Y2P8T0_9FLAO|nr:trehalase family glycosidase [Tenacibaculum holothuriorum]OSY86833.1 trehalase [Tenacibaculum holothuriorum]